MQEKEINQDMVRKIIDRLPVFDRFSEAEKNALLEHHNYFAVYHIDEPLIQEAATDNSFFVLVSGAVRVMKKNCSLHIADLEPGDIFGEIAFLTPRSRTASVIANNDDVIALRMNKEILAQLDVQIREKIKDKVIEKLIERLDRMNTAIARLSY